MNDPARGNAWKPVLVVAIFLLAAFSAVGGYYRFAGIQEAPPQPKPKPQAGRAIAVIAPDSQSQSSHAPGPDATAVPPPPVVSPEKTPPRISMWDPLEQFRKDTKTALLQTLTPAFSELPRYLSVEQDDSRIADAGYRRFLMQFFDATENAKPDQQPAMLLAADFMAWRAECPFDAGKVCDEMRGDFAQHKLSMEGDQLGGGYFYKHDLLWRLWHDYPDTDWGERGFVLLLDSGWDTSVNCAKGSDQFREVIRQGESFLQQHPSSSYRSFVSHLVGQAYATWWALSKGPPGMEDHADPKLYQKGAAEARVKAIEYFEQVPKLAPGTSLAAYAQEILPGLRDQQVIRRDGFKFFCVYD